MRTDTASPAPPHASGPPSAAGELVGHEAAESAFLAAVRSGRLHHGWLITGPAGIGKATLAFRCARYLLAGPPEAGALSSLTLSSISADHPAARRLAAGAHADVVVVERTRRDNGTLRDEIVVEDVRRIEPLFRRTAGEDGWRVAVVDGADRMNVAAQNAVLKVLEEPPPGALLLLTAESPGRLLPTLRSRVRLLTLSALGPLHMQAVLARLLPSSTPEERAALAHLAEGSPGQALRVHQAEVIPLYQELLELLAVPDRPSPRQLLDFAEKVGRKEADDAYAALSTLFAGFLARVAKAAALGGAVSEPPSPVADIVARWAAALGLERALAVWDKVRGLFAQADTLTLDRKQVMLTALLALWSADPAGR